MKKPKRFRVSAMAGEIEMEILEALGGQTVGIEELVTHFLLTHKTYKKNKEVDRKRLLAAIKKLNGGRL